MKSNKIRIALLGITACAVVSYAVTKSDISRTTDALAGSGRLVSNSAIDFSPTGDVSPEAWKIFRWKIWRWEASKHVGQFFLEQGLRYAFGGAVAVAQNAQEEYRIAQREAMLDELN